MIRFIGTTSKTTEPAPGLVSPKANSDCDNSKVTRRYLSRKEWYFGELERYKLDNHEFEDM